ncbi:MAG: pilus assembly protein PilM [Planctomycetota bacterium]
MARGSLGALKHLGSMGGPSKPGRFRPVGVDFGTYALKVMQLTGGDRPSLVSAASIDTPHDLLADPAGRLAFQTQQLPGLVRSAGFKGKRAVCLLPAPLTYTTHLQVPKGDDNMIEGASRIAVGAQLGCDPASLVMRWHEVGPSNQGQGKLEVLAMASPRRTVDRLMQALAGAKLEPVGMRTEPVALLRGFQSLGLTSETETTLYLDLGYGTTKALIAHGQKLLFARTIELGGAALDREIAERRKVSAERSHELRLGCIEFSGVEKPPVASVTALGGGGVARVGESGLRMPAAMTDSRKSVSVLPDVRESLEMLGDEVSMCLRYHQSLFPSSPVTRVVLTGGESRHLGLCRRVAGAARVSVQAGDPARAIGRTGKEPSAGVDLAQPMPGWAAVLGLGMCPTDL